jgi:RimJ/RimL family protein N-acetyltransferase
MIALKPTTEFDLGFVLAAQADEDTCRYIIPWSRERHLAALADLDCAHLMICAAGSGEFLGFVLLYGMASQNRSVELRRIVCTRKGCGFGRAAILEVKRLAFGRLNAHRLWLDVKSKNSRARRLYASEGFIEEGVMRECLLEGDGFESLVLMSILQDESAAHA